MWPGFPKWLESAQYQMFLEFYKAEHIGSSGHWHVPYLDLVCFWNTIYLECFPDITQVVFWIWKDSESIGICIMYWKLNWTTSKDRRFHFNVRYHDVSGHLRGTRTWLFSSLLLTSFCHFDCWPREHHEDLPACIPFRPHRFGHGLCPYGSSQGWVYHRSALRRVESLPKILRPISLVNFVTGLWICEDPVFHPEFLHGLCVGDCEIGCWNMGFEVLRNLQNIS